MRERGRCGAAFARNAVTNFAIRSTAMAGRRSSWKGYLTIDLVAFQVQAFNAAEHAAREKFSSTSFLRSL